jgi:hypothetical protein
MILVRGGAGEGAAIASSSWFVTTQDAIAMVRKPGSLAGMLDELMGYVAAGSPGWIPGGGRASSRGGCWQTCHGRTAGHPSPSMPGATSGGIQYFLGGRGGTLVPRWRARWRNARLVMCEPAACSHQVSTSAGAFRPDALAVACLDQPGRRQSAGQGAKTTVTTSGPEST